MDSAYLKANRYSYDFGKSVLGKCCQFNWFLIERGITSANGIREPLNGTLRVAGEVSLLARQSGPQGIKPKSKNDSAR
jgi:hypothetical protein